MVIIIILIWAKVQLVVVVDWFGLERSPKIFTIDSA